MDKNVVIEEVASLTTPDFPSTDSLPMFYKEEALIEAAERGKVDEIRCLLSAGADVQYKDSEGWSALHHAARLGHLEAASVLLDYGADVESRDQIGLSPLHNASYEAHSAIVSLLLCHGANVNSMNYTRRTPLHFAAESGNEKTIGLLLATGADPLLEDVRGRKPFDMTDCRKVRQLFIIQHLYSTSVKLKKK